MTKLQHTPGPWDFTGINIHTSDEESDIAAVYLRNFTKEEIKIAESDARLIAAAPDMLEALINEANNQIIRAQVVKNIIERATGLKIEEVLKCST